MAKLSHPNIMPVLFVGREREVPFFVMPRVQGSSIAEMIATTGSLDPKQVVRLLRDIAAALDYAHDAGVIHRDVKPANILVDSATGRAVLTDFGIAKAVIPEGVSAATVPGVFLGTPQYSAPEQIAGERDVGPRADIYSFAVVVYEMIAGRVPFDATSASRIAAQQLFATVPPLSRYAPRVSRKIDTVMARALAKHPSDRYATASEFARAVESVLA